MYPHRIRLRGPWDWETASARGTLTMPAVLPVPGPVSLRRRFGWPGRTESHERVWLTIAGLPGPATIVLNDQHVGSSASACEFDVTALLQPRNVLVVRFEAAVAGPVAEVGLEVRCTAWLRDVQCTLTSAGCLIVGEVAGSAERPLDLYLLVDRVTAAYTSVAAGSRFELRTVPQPATNAMRLELVNGGVVWHVLELPESLTADSASN